MAAFDLGHLPATSACATVARSSAVEPEFVVADSKPSLMAALWRRRQALLGEPALLDDHLLSYCMRGGPISTLVVDGVRRRLVQQTGAVIFLPAHHPVQWLLEGAGEMVHIHLYVRVDALPARTAPGVLLNLHDPWLDSYFRLLLAEYQVFHGARANGCFDFLDRTGDMLVRRLASLRDDARPPGPASRVSPLRAPVLRRVESYVESNLAADIRLHDLAAIAAMSVDHFVRAFRAATGSTPHSWLLERRLDRAATLLRDSPDKVSSIARRCGFSGAAHFATAFRSRHGLSPTQFRRRS